MNCPRCGAPTTHVPQYQNWYCHPCAAYVPVARAKGVNLWLAIGLPLALVAVAIGVFVFITTRSFKNYMDKSKRSEVHLHLRQIQQGAKMYFLEEHAAPDGLQMLPGQLPGPRAGPTPEISCCEKGGKCLPDHTLWEGDPVWAALNFGVYGSHYYQYEYERDADGQGFTARALGDLDCDGLMSTFEAYGRVEGGELQFAPSVFEQDPLE